MVGMVGASVSFEEGAGLLRDLAGIRVPTRQVERYAERLGEEAARFEREVSEAPPGPLAQTMYLGQDGTGVPMRKEELADRPGKQADGSSRTREMSSARSGPLTPGTGTGAPPATRAPSPTPPPSSAPRPRRRTSCSRRSPQRVEREARRRGFDTASQKVAIGDGAAWLWGIVAECFPCTIEILDKFHAKEHVHDVANALSAR